MPTEQHSPAPRRPWPIWAIFLAGALTISLVVGGVYLVSRPGSNPAHAAALTLPGHIHEPEWMPTAAPSVKNTYAWAAQHYEELQYIACWCGCDNDHANNFECYWKHDGTGTITDYESHGYG